MVKTATIRINHIFGTRNSYCGDVFYRGKLLFTCEGKEPNKLKDSCAFWARGQGFTDLKITFG